MYMGRSYGGRLNYGGSIVEMRSWTEEFRSIDPQATKKIPKSDLVTFLQRIGFPAPPNDINTFINYLPND